MSGISRSARRRTAPAARRRIAGSLAVAVIAVAATVSIAAVSPVAASASTSASTSASRRSAGVWRSAAAVDPDLAAAAAKGPVAVIAQLSDAGLPTTSSPAALGARRAAVAQTSVRLAAALPADSVSRVQALGSQPMVAMTVDARGLAALRAQPDVVRVVRNHFDPLSTAYEANIGHVGAPTAWAKGDTGAGQAVAIIDTGVDKSVPFLAGKVVAEGCFTSAQDDGFGGTSTPVCPGGTGTSTAPGSGAPCPLAAAGCDQGTQVAGIAAGGAAGVGPLVGVAPGAKLIAVDVFSEFTSAGACAPAAPPCIAAWESDQIRALDYVYGLRTSFDIASVNMSLGRPVTTDFDAHCDGEPQKPAIDQLRAAGIATVVASGDESAHDVDSPSCISSAIAVGAGSSSAGGAIDGDTNWSPALALFAPGDSILSSLPTGTTGASPCPSPYGAAPCGSLRGSTAAAPHVAAALAVLRQAEPGLAVSQEIDRLQGTGVSQLADGDFYFPDLRVGNAVTQQRPTSFGGGVTANGDGRLEVFRGTASGIQHKWQKTPNGQWSAWSSLAGPIHGAPVAVTDYDGRVEVFGTASNGALYHAWQKTPGGTWSSWASLGGSIQSGKLTIFMNVDGHLEMFAVQADEVMHQWQTSPGGPWSGWRSANSHVSGIRGISSVRLPDGYAVVALVDGNGNSRSELQEVPGGTWFPWIVTNAPSGTPSPPMVGAPIIGVDLDGRTEILTSDTSGRLWTAYSGYAGGEIIAESIAVRSGFDSGNLAIGRNGDGRLEVMDERSGRTVVHAWQTSPGGTWSAAALLPSSIGAIAAPIQQLADLDGRLELFSPQGGRHAWQVDVDGPWSAWADL